MTTTIRTHEVTVPEADFRVSPLDEAVEKIRDDALTQARKKLHIRYRGLDLESLLRHPHFVGQFMHGLISGVAEALAVNDQRVQAIYTYDPALNTDSESGEASPLDTTLHLLVRVATSSAALEAFIAALDRALTDSLKELPSPLFAERKFTLDVSLITEKDVRLGLGPAGLLSAIFTPPIKVWQRRA